MNFSTQDIKGIAGSAVFERGKRYFLNGRVLEISAEGEKITGKVRGSRLDPYKVVAYLDKEEILSSCSCPYEWGTCKHVVAVLLAKLAEQNSGSYAGLGRGFFPAPQMRHTGEEQGVLLDTFRNRAYWEWPKLQIGINSCGLIGSKGIRIKISVIYNGQFQEVLNLGEIVGEPYLFRRTGFPEFSKFNPLQQHCIKMLYSFLQDEYSYEMRIKPVQFALLLNEIEGEGITLFDLKRKKPIPVCPNKKIPLACTAGLTKEGQLRAQVDFLDPDDRQKKLEGLCLFDGRPIWFFDQVNSRFLPLDKSVTQELAFNFMHRESVISKEQIPYFFTFLAPQVEAHGELIVADERLKGFKIQETSPKIQLFLEYHPYKGINLELKIAYPHKELSSADLLAPQHFYSVNEDGNNHLQWFRRDRAAEYEIFKRLVDDCKFIRNNTASSFILTNPDHVFNFLFERLPELQEKYEIFYSDAFKKRHNPELEFFPEIKASAEGIDWFHFDVHYRAKGIDESFSHDQIRRQLLAGKRYIRLKSGECIPIAKERFEAMNNLFSEFGSPSERLKAFHVPFFVEEARNYGIQAEFTKELEKLYNSLKNFRALKKAVIPKQLKGTLRDYQENGLDWLEFLHQFHFGGILADEMGLGKTLQALAIIQREKERGVKTPSLVICPTTLVWNWEAEAHKFIPNLKILILQGKERRRQMQGLPEADIVVTSYALLRRDIAIYGEIEFNYLILDEAQNIKNRHTLNARVCKQLKGRHCLALSGTPLENSIEDIWSIFDFLMPSFLGRYEKFKQRYEAPILKNQDKARLELLSRKMRPFILRRLKKEVIKELPAKIEQVSFCELEPTQCRIYEEMLVLGKEKVLSAFRKQGFVRSRMVILTVILRLRQICCHPELAGVKLGHRAGVSAKLNLLKELLSESLSGGHKILVFSQFVQMLKIIEAGLKKDKINYAYLDGKTKERKSVVEQFNNDNSLRVFLLSLKVGGLGLNLTSADTVILYEPWWNPAVENQAIDRTHRIGQKKAVGVYKLIAKGTIEEKILKLQEKKKSLVDSLIISEEGIAKKLGWEDIKFLLDIN